MSTSSGNSEVVVSYHSKRSFEPAVGGGETDEVSSGNLEAAGLTRIGEDQSSCPPGGGEAGVCREGENLAKFGIIEEGGSYIV